MKAFQLNAIATAAAIALCAGIGTAGGVYAAENPFASLAGSWSGVGRISVQDGSSERIRCRGSYRPDRAGTSLALHLRCASDSYTFELSSDITNERGVLSGSWNESSRQVYGSLSGRVAGGHIQATASSPAFTATLSIETRGNSQNVVIRAPGSQISEVTVRLARAGR